LGATPDSYTMHSLLLSLATNDRCADALSMLQDWHRKTAVPNHGTTGVPTGAATGASTGGPTTMSCNILLQACSDSCDTDMANAVLGVMDGMGIAPDATTTHLIHDIFGHDQEQWTTPTRRIMASKSTVAKRRNGNATGKQNGHNGYNEHNEHNGHNGQHHRPQQQRTLHVEGSGARHHTRTAIEALDRSTTEEPTYVNVRNLTVSQCQDALNEGMQPKSGDAASNDLIIITGYGKVHEIAMTWLNRRDIHYETSTNNAAAGRRSTGQPTPRGRIVVRFSERMEYSIRMENQLRNDEVLRSSLVRGVAVMCLVGLPLFGNPIFLFFSSLQ
jgi:pentatricopeptide repeat protein